MRRIFSFILCILIILLIHISASASSGTLTISFKIGSSKIHINSILKTVESPYMQNKSVFVPLQSFLEAYGGEVSFKEKGKVNLIYRDTDISFTIGNKNYIANEISRPFIVAPKLVHSILMVPVNFLTDNFGGKLSYNKNNKTYSLILEDDGAITDFSTVIGSISKAKVGNSYFGWSISIPKGSQLVNNSFNSKDVSIGNDQRGIFIDVNVSVDEGKKYQDFINEMQKTSGNSSIGDSVSGKILDSSINTDTSLGFAEVLTSDYNSGGIIRRIFISNGYVYKLTFSSIKEINPKKLKKDTYFMSLLNSFTLGYKGNTKDVKDISKVKAGVVKFTDTNYGFSLNVPPEWETLDSTDFTNIPAIKIGLNNKEYITIYPEFIEGTTDIDEYGDTVKAFYNVNYNSKFYNFIDKKTSEIYNKKACKLLYSIDIKGAKSIFDENLIIEGDIIYHITIKSPEASYKSKNEIYGKILNSINYSSKNAESIKKYLEGSKTDAVMSRVGKDDNLIDFTEKDYKWKIKIPGFWLSIPYFEDNYKIFSDEKNQAYMGIESIENNSDTLKQDDKTVFDTLKSIQDGKDNYTFISKEIITEKGTTIKVHKYRLDDDKTDTHGDVIHYVINGEKYSYCFFYILQDIYASEKNAKEIKDIWDSFTVIK